MKRFVFALAIAGALLGLGGCGGAMSEPPVTVEAKFLENIFYGNPIPAVEVTAGFTAQMRGHSSKHTRFCSLFERLLTRANSNMIQSDQINQKGFEMSSVTVETELLERVVREGIENALARQKEVIEEAFLEVLEDIGLAKAMEEKSGDSVSEETVLDLLSGHATSV